MNRIPVCVAVLFLLTGPVFGGFEIWTAGEGSAGCVTGRDILTLQVDGDYTLLCALQPATFSGIPHSTDHGETWIPAESGAPQGVTVTDLEYIPESPPYILASAFQGTPPGGGGVYRSTDAGLNWQQFTSGFPSADIRAVLSDPSDPARVFAGAVFDGFFVSTDRGETWSASSTGLTNLRVQVLQSDPNIPGLLYCGSLVGFYRSTDSGSTWTLLTLPHENPQIVTALVLPHQPGTILVSYKIQSVNYIVRSTDSGESWQSIDSGLPDDKQVRSLAFNPDISGHVYCGTVYDGVFRSIQNGTTWNSFAEGLPDEAFYTVACIGYAASTGDDTCRLFACTNDSGDIYLRDESLPTPTATVPPTQAPTRTPTPVPTQSPIPSATPTAFPSITPTPTPYPFGIEFEIPDDHLTEGDEFWLDLIRLNPYDEAFMYPVFIVLDVGGAYWFWPSWRMYDPVSQTGIDYDLIEFPPGISRLDIIPAFNWPAGTGSASGLFFWGGVMDPQIEYLLGDLIHVEFSYDA